MDAIASQITSLTMVYSTVYSDADQWKHQRSASLAFVWGIHRGPVNSPHKWPVTRKMFPFDDVIVSFVELCSYGTWVPEWQQDSTGSGFLPKRRQHIAWTNADPVQVRIWASPSTQWISNHAACIIAMMYKQTHRHTHRRTSVLVPKLKKNTHCGLWKH